MIEDLHPTTAAALDPEHPVVMLNLMKFRDTSADGDGTGWDAYVRYSKLANKLIKQNGGRIAYAGEVKGTTFGPEIHGDWDYLALVTYETPAGFLAMMESAEYAVANTHRENGCESHIIMALHETFNGMGG